MKVAIEARVLNSNSSAGVKTYVRELIVQLKMHAEVDLAVFDDIQSDFMLPWWMNVTLPREMKRVQPEVVHYTKAAISRKKIAPTVVSIHDIIPILFPSTQKLAQRLHWPRVLRYAAVKSDHVLTISNESKKGIVEQFGVAPERVTVTPLAVDREHFKPVESDRGVVKGPYILFLGTRDMRKNVKLLIRAFARIEHEIPHRLVIAGRQAMKIDDAEKQAQELGLSDRVHWLDYTNYEDMPALYSGADVFVWPSIYEGWGLPPQEAMACGTPVIVSDGGSLPEVVGEAGEVVAFSTDILRERLHDDTFERELADRMLMVLEDTVRQEEMRAAGLARVHQFSWEEVARKTVAVYKELI